MNTLICVPVMVLDRPSALADAAAARDAGADLVEFRIDEFFSGSTGPDGLMDEGEVEAILRLVSESPLPCIVTCRAAIESGGVGGYDGDDMARVSLYERLGTVSPRTSTDGVREHPPRYIDVEYATYTRSANIRQKVNLAVDHPAQQRDVRTRLILSMHDFEGRPADLLRRVAKMAAEPAAGVVKVATTARSIRDNLEVLDLLSDGAGTPPLVALAMGRFGLMSRVLAPKFGGYLTFAALRPAASTAPGQPTVRELMDVFRFRSITRRTRVFGVIGWPVEHSMSPLVHNAGFEALSGDQGAGFDGVYLPMPVPPEWEHFKATLAAMIDHSRLDFSGASVTAPHKQHLVQFAREAMAAAGEEAEWSIDEVSQVCSAANTLVIERDAGGSARRVRVVNTDAHAAAERLGEALGSLAGKRVGLVGSGGVARAIAVGLLAADADVVVLSRTASSVAKFVEELNTARRGRVSGGRLRGDESGHAARHELEAVINCTPVGMSGGPDPSGLPIDLDALLAGGGRPVVFDTVYNPVQTPLLQRARERGLEVIDGVGMFVAQAAEQFRLWTGQAAPRGLFAQICREALGGEVQR